MARVMRQGSLLRYVKRECIKYEPSEQFWNEDILLRRNRLSCVHLSNSIWYFERLVTTIRHSLIDVVTLRDLSVKNSKGPKLAFRFDIDIDPAISVKMATYLAFEGMPGSFYFLHTASYYGEWCGKTFVRNSKLRSYIREISACGMEVGLHNDLLGSFISHKLDPVDVLDRELDWLRSVGGDVRGTVAHNSLPVYGAANSEVFSECMLWKRKVYSKNGILPLSVCSMKQFGLEYEGTFFNAKKNLDMNKVKRFVGGEPIPDIRSQEWFYDWIVNNPIHNNVCDYQIWVISKEMWVIAGNNENMYFKWGVGFDDVIDFISNVQGDVKIMVVIHPVYFCEDVLV